MSIQNMIENIRKSKMHENVGGEQLTTQRAGDPGNRELHEQKAKTRMDIRKRAAVQKLGKSSTNQAPAVKEGVGDVASKIQQSKGGNETVKGDNTVDNSEKPSNKLGLTGESASSLSSNIQALGSTNAGSGAMNGAMQAGMASGGNPFAMAGGAIMGVLQSKENREKAMQMVEAAKIKEQQQAESRKQDVMSQLQGNIGSAFRAATKSVSF